MTMLPYDLNPTYPIPLRLPVLAPNNNNSKLKQLCSHQPPSSHQAANRRFRQPPKALPRVACRLPTAHTTGRANRPTPPVFVSYSQTVTPGFLPPSQCLSGYHCHSSPTRLHLSLNHTPIGRKSWTDFVVTTVTQTPPLPPWRAPPHQPSSTLFPPTVHQQSIPHFA